MDINIFAMKYYLILVSSYFLFFFKSFISKSTQLLRPLKGNSGVSFNDWYPFLWRNPRKDLNLHSYNVQKGGATDVFFKSVVV